MITPSATSPASSRIRGPLAAMYTGICRRQSKPSCAPLTVKCRPAKSTFSPAVSPRMIWIASRSAPTGFTRSMPNCSSPPPAPRASTARPPDSSSTVAMAAAVSAGWRV